MGRDQHHGAVRQYKGTTVFDWDSEPADERPSEFTSSSLGSGSSRRSGYEGIEVRRRRPPRKRAGMSVLMRAFVLVLVLSAIAIVVGSVLLQR
ncbi:MAG: hypothetical protein KGL43_15235 [Burkholderiales bacterium]|nr:hypothetical protein [Burkholderiales bacterium]MDE2394114.1 hypothetical protein [Burkholderiales bacterium]MDE2454945.1 hypothetical protein [Burkholderiales bacterium]